jgi:hypothetical protein
VLRYKASFILDKLFPRTVAVKKRKTSEVVDENLTF